MKYDSYSPSNHQSQQIAVGTKNKRRRRKTQYLSEVHLLDGIEAAHSITEKIHFVESNQLPSMLPASICHHHFAGKNYMANEYEQSKNERQTPLTTATRANESAHSKTFRHHGKNSNSTEFSDEYHLRWKSLGRQNCHVIPRFAHSADVIHFYSFVRPMFFILTLILLTDIYHNLFNANAQQFQQPPPLSRPIAPPSALQLLARPQRQQQVSGRIRPSSSSLISNVNLLPSATNLPLSRPKTTNSSSRSRSRTTVARQTHSTPKQQHQTEQSQRHDHENNHRLAKSSKQDNNGHQSVHAQSKQQDERNDQANGKAQNEHHNTKRREDQKHMLGEDVGHANPVGRSANAAKQLEGKRKKEGKEGKDGSKGSDVHKRRSSKVLLPEKIQRIAKKIARRKNTHVGKKSSTPKAAKTTAPSDESFKHDAALPPSSASLLMSVNGGTMAVATTPTSGQRHSGDSRTQEKSEPSSNAKNADVHPPGPEHSGKVVAQHPPKSVEHSGNIAKNGSNSARHPMAPPTKEEVLATLVGRGRMSARVGGVLPPPKMIPQIPATSTPNALLVAKKAPSPSPPHVEEPDMPNASDDMDEQGPMAPGQQPPSVEVLKALNNASQDSFMEVGERLQLPQLFGFDLDSQ